MKLSTIIPAHNAEATIRQCLEAIYNSDYKDFEAIVVDDASTDRTADIAGEFACRVIKLSKNVGPAHARNKGLQEALHDILVFIDADIVINKNSLGRLRDIFLKEPEAAAIIGILSKEHPNKNFFSVYKNLYMHYVFSRCPRYVDFTYGAFFAVKKRSFESPKTLERFGEDTEVGMLIQGKRGKILLDKESEVVHLKRHTFPSFLKNDFRIPHNWARIFMQEKGLQSVLRKKRFSHAQLYQIVSILIAPFIILCGTVHPLYVAILIAFFLVLNHKFFLFLYKERGGAFMVKAIFITWLDMLVMGAGIAFGFASLLFRREHSGIKLNKKIGGFL
jgi:glycosyltransferase involved in cell wall biosynthesis